MTVMMSVRASISEPSQCVLYVLHPLISSKEGFVILVFQKIESQRLSY